MTVLLLQIGSFFQGSFETFYTWNHYLVAGVSIAEHKIGLFHQQASINPDKTLYKRQGMYAELYFGNIDEIAYFYGGGRLAISNDNFVGFTPHLTLAWRVSKNAEIPITFSTYSSRLVNSIGLRLMFRGNRQHKVRYTKGRTLQPTTIEPNLKQ
jgi:hypothetical protein